MHSRIRTETVKLWRPGQGLLQILKSQVYWKPAHTWALFVVCCHHGLCGSAAAHTAKLASNIINRHPKLPGRDPGLPKRHYTSRSATQSLQKEQWELKPLAPSLPELLALTGSRPEPEGQELGRPSVHWFHTTSKTSGKFKSLEIHSPCIYTPTYCIASVTNCLAD